MQYLTCKEQLLKGLFSHEHQEAQVLIPKRDQSLHEEILVHQHSTHIAHLYFLFPLFFN